MVEFINGMPASLIPGHWVKSRQSEAQGMCVEAIPLPHGGVALRNSTDPNGPALVFTDGEMSAFLNGVKNGEFDPLVGAN